METIEVKDKLFVVNKKISDYVLMMTPEQKYNFLSDLANKQARSKVPLGIVVEMTKMEGLTN